jgi:hypothetical protein
MKRLLLTTFSLALLGLLAPSSARAQSGFDGTWKINLNKAQMSEKPDVLLLQNGTYQCSTCVPSIAVKADGQDYAVSGHPYFNTVAVEVVDPNTIRETDKKDGRVVGTSLTKVAPDGQTATIEFSDSSNTNSQPVVGKVLLARVGDAAPAGAHAISGSWRTSGFDQISDNGLTFTYRNEGDTLVMSTPTGQSYRAKLDGAEAPYGGDPGVNSVSVKQLGPNMVQETDMRDGKVVSVAVMTLGPDGRTISIAFSDKLHGTDSSFVAERQ